MVQVVSPAALGSRRAVPGARVRSAPGSRQALTISAILLLALLLRLPYLTRSLWFDELWATSVHLRSLASTVRTVLTDNHPGFYTVFSFVWLRLVGDSELAVRLPALVFGLASIV